jgi:hypothetical protein
MVNSHWGLGKDVVCLHRIHHLEIHLHQMPNLVLVLHHHTDVLEPERKLESSARCRRRHRQRSWVSIRQLQ